MQPERIEKYEIVEEIGHGGMATVYRARDCHLDRMVALKVMHPHLHRTGEARRRFAREAVTVARLKHPNILEIYDYSGESSDVGYIATELLTGPTLKRFVEEHGELPPEIVACIGIQLARALSAAHAHGVVHRDVKPENVLLHEDREVKLTDFGIAQLVDSQTMTTTGQVIGSPGHMAPEQVEGRELGPQSDLFSLGTVLYLLATGELPFQGRNAPQVLKQIVEGQFVDPQRLRPQIGGRLRGVIMRCLEVDQTRRYADAGALTDDLLAFVREMGIDKPGEALADYLHEPEAFAARFRTRTIERLIELGEQAHKRGALPEALDHFNRVLAMDEGNARVLAAVQGIGRYSRLRRTALIGAAVAAALAAAGLVIYQGIAPVPSPSSAVHVRVPPAAEAPDPPAFETRAVPDEVPKVPPEADRRPQPAKERPPRATGPRRVIFQPFPANVSIGINGQAPRPFGPSFREVELEPGEHDFTFVGAHDCCVDAEFKVRIPPGDEPLTISRRLAFRPAGLYVVSDVPANVIVDGGKVSGRTRNVINVVGLESMVETHAIRVTAPGVTDHVRDVQLTAGRVATVEVALRPGG